MIIVDTGAFVALFHRRDRFHPTARQVFGISPEQLITTYPVISETCYLLSQQANLTTAQTFLQGMANEIAQIFPLQLSHLKRMIVLMKKYEDLPMDFADASLVVLAEELGHGRILTLDRRDFSVYRWNDTQPFQNLLLPD